MCQTWGGGQLLLDFVSIYTKKENHFFFFFFPAENPIPHSRSRKSSSTGAVGRVLLGPYTPSGSRDAAEALAAWATAQGPGWVSPRVWGWRDPPAPFQERAPGGRGLLGGLCLAPQPPLLPGELPASPNTIPDFSAWMREKKTFAPVTWAHRRGLAEGARARETGPL